MVAKTLGKVERSTETKFLVSLLVSLFFSTSPVLALSGDEFSVTEEPAAKGYIVGVLEYVLNVGHTNQELRTIYEAQGCVKNGNFKLEDIYRDTKSQISKDAALKSQPAVISVMKVLIAKCPNAWRVGK